MEKKYQIKASCIKEGNWCLTKTYKESFKPSMIIIASLEETKWCFTSFHAKRNYIILAVLIKKLFREHDSKLREG